MRPFAIPQAWSGFKGYKADRINCPPDKLAPPSQNCLVNDDGIAECRLGYLEEFSIGVDGRPATSYYHETYDITFFALGTKVYYRDHTNNVTYDTGLTLTDGTTTRFDSYLGDVYLTNTTDGLRRIVVMRLNDAAANSGDANVTVDVDGAARLSVFSITSGNLRINGTNEAFNAVNVGTGVLTLTGTLSASYNDNTVAIVVSDISSGREKASKVLFWKERMHLMGFPSATNADQPNNTVVAGQFVIGQTGASGIELIIDFTYGTGGSTKITVGKGGSLKNIVGAKDYIYFLTEKMGYATAASAIDTTGSGIGGTIPILKDEVHGCLNEDAVAIIGNNEITYIADKRIIRIKTATDSGLPLVFPEETFDVDMRDELKNMDEDQTGALAFYHTGKRRSIYQVKIGGQYKWLVYDHNIGAWQPPQQVIPVKSFFERKGVLWGTDASDDIVYSFNTIFDDNGIPIECTIATAEFDVDDSMLSQAKMKGELNQPALVELKSYVTNETAGRRSGSAKIVDGSSYTYLPDHGVGTDAVGDGEDGAFSETAGWKKTWDVFPSEGNRVQLIAYNFTEGGWFSVSKFEIKGQSYSSSFSPSA